MALSALLLSVLLGMADPAAEAVRLYDLGRYDEAAPILQELEASGKADGAALYRLAFIRRRAGDTAGERALLERAIEKLSVEAASATTLEPAFYLSNAYRNLNRATEARAAATAATARAEARPAPADPVERFRLAKLYEDQGRPTEAAKAYAGALEVLDPARHPAYVGWARRYLADVAYARADFAGSEKALAPLVDAGLAGQADLDRLGSALAKQGRFADAADAWKRAEEVDRTRADRVRYAGRLARAASELSPLPTALPDGTPLHAATREQLEQAMSGVEKRVREIKTQAAELPG